MLTELIIFAIVFAIVLSASGVMAVLVITNIMLSKKGIEKYTKGIKQMTESFENEDLF